MKSKHQPWLAFISLIICIAWGANACAPTPPPPATALPATATNSMQSLPTPSQSPSPVLTDLASATPTHLPTETASVQPSETITPTLLPSLTPSPIATYSKLRGEVIIDQAVCHYGPGAPYLYKYGVYKGSHMEILRRIDPGNYIEVEAIRGNNPCWVRADYMKIDGDINNLQPVNPEDLHMPPSPYYGPLTGVQAKRNGNEVTVTWNPLILKAGDSSLQTPYIVEAFVCQYGKLAFIPAGSEQTSVKITDEPGCPFTSRARVIAAEKHGYTRPVTVPWPPALP